VYVKERCDGGVGGMGGGCWGAGGVRVQCVCAAAIATTRYCTRPASSHGVLERVMVYAPMAREQWLMTDLALLEKIQQQRTAFDFRIMRWHSRHHRRAGAGAARYIYDTATQEMPHWRTGLWLV
jgi:hypothetical protein